MGENAERRTGAGHRQQRRRARRRRVARYARRVMAQGDRRVAQRIFFSWRAQINNYCRSVGSIP